MTKVPGTAERGSGGDASKGRWLERCGRLAPLLIGGYFAVHAAGRVAVPGALGLDEAQIMVQAQSLEWGYGPQPPLYAWLQAAAFALLGEGKLALAVVKNALMAAALVGVWAVARLAGASPRLALFAALTVFLIPGFAWEAHRALTHTPLALACAAATLWIFVMARRRAHPLRAIALGVALACGLLAKWNIAFFASGVLLTMLVEPRGDRRFPLIAFATALVLVAPMGLWYLGNVDAAAGAVGELDLARTSFFSALPGALLAFAEATGATLGVVVVIFALLLARRPAVPADEPIDAAARRDLTRILALTAVAVLVAVVAAGASEVKERWVTPLFFAAPLVLTLWGASRLTAARLAPAVVGIAAVALLIVPGLQWNWRIGDVEPPRETADFAPVAAAVAAVGDTVLASNDWIGGNLLLEAPELAVLSPETSALRLALSRPVQLVWRGEQATPPAPLLALFRDRFAAEPRIVRVDRLTVGWLPPHGEAEPLILGRAVVR